MPQRLILTYYEIIKVEIEERNQCSVSGSLN
jgi:hypothetical protein